jgi:SAM-dependent methyltransferase
LINTARVLLALLRGGDYAHAGDREAVDIVLEKVCTYSPEIKTCLDFGCGMGGTAGDLAKRIDCVWGLDPDLAAINYAKLNYEQVTFIHDYGENIDRYFEENSLDLITLFNVLYAIEDKRHVLEKLSHIAKPGAILAILDYTQRKENLDLFDLANKPMYPIVLEEQNEQLMEMGWIIHETMDLTHRYFSWYEDLLIKLSSEEHKHPSDDVKKLRETFTNLKDQILNGALGGALIIAIKL